MNQAKFTTRRADQRARAARKLVFGGIVLSGLVSLATPAFANYIQNGSFATGSSTGAFVGWTQGGVTSFSNTCATNCVGVGGYVAGMTYAALGPVGGIGTLSQSFTLPSSGSYRLIFSLAMTAGNNSDTFSALINNNTVVGPILDTAAFSFGLRSVVFQGNAGTNTLSFSFRQDPGYYALTNISIDAAPQPIPGSGFLSYLVLGLLGLGWWGHKARSPKSATAANFAAT